MAGDLPEEVPAEVPAEVAEQLRAASLEVDGVIDLLVSASPASLDSCALILESAGRRVAALPLQVRAQLPAQLQAQLQEGCPASSDVGRARLEALRLRS